MDYPCAVLPTEHLLAFMVIATVLIAVPGPSVLFVVTRSLTLGRRAGLATVVGNAAGVYVQVVFVALGVGAIVQESIAVFTVIKLAGALYLVYLGVQSFRHRRELAAALGRVVEPRELRRILTDAFVVGVANPKVIVFFVAVLPQFVDPSSGSVALQLLTLGAVFCTIALVCDGIWALAAGAARNWLVRSPRRLEAIGGTGGIVMIGLGAGLAVSGRKRREARGAGYCVDRVDRVEVDRAPAVDELVDLEDVEILAQAAGAAGGVGGRQVPEQHDLPRRDLDDLDVIDARRIQPRRFAIGARVEQAVAAVGLHARKVARRSPGGCTRARYLIARAAASSSSSPWKTSPAGSQTAGTSRTPRRAASAVAAVEPGRDRR